MKKRVVLLTICLITQGSLSMDIDQLLSNEKKIISQEEFSQRAVNYLKKRLKRALKIKKMQSDFWTEAAQAKDPFCTFQTLLKNKCIKENNDLMASLPFTVVTQGIEQQIIQSNPKQNDKYHRILGKNHKLDAKDYYPFFCFVQKLEKEYLLTKTHIDLLKSLTIAFELEFNKFKKQAEPQDEFEAKLQELHSEIEALKKTGLSISKDRQTLTRIASRSTALMHLPTIPAQSKIEVDFLESPRSPHKPVKGRKPTPVRMRPQQTIIEQEHRTRARSHSFNELDIKQFAALEKEVVGAGEIR